MIMPTRNLYRLGIITIAVLGGVARPASAADAPGFPRLFVATWGRPGPTCQTDLPHRFKIEPSRAIADRTVMRVAGIRKTADNVVRVRFDVAGRSHVETLTVGTTGSRLFREREGRETMIYYSCE